MHRKARKLPNEAAVSAKRVDPSVLRPNAAINRKTVFPVWFERKMPRAVTDAVSHSVRGFSTPSRVEALETAHVPLLTHLERRRRPELPLRSP
jgi:hypothetical protein